VVLHALDSELDPRNPWGTLERVAQDRGAAVGGEREPLAE